MNAQERVVVTANELVAATKDTNVRKITVRGNLSNTPSVRLAPGQALSGIDNASILFDSVDGLQLTSDNQVRGLSLQTAPGKRAIFNDTGVAGLGQTGAIYSDGGIAPGTPDAITGGVFTVFNAFVDVVRNRGPVTTYGVNDMVLDNWGSVDRWIAEEKITSYGPSGIGFVNFGIVNSLEVQAPIETFGQGARGFNVYAGTVNRAVFDRIATHADGAVGIQISQPIGTLEVHRGIETFGGTGDSLVKGVVVTLSAIALSVKPGGSARAIDIQGGVTTHGKGVSPLELDGLIGQLSIDGGIGAAATPS